MFWRGHVPNEVGFPVGFAVHVSCKKHPLVAIYFHLLKNMIYFSLFSPVGFEENLSLLEICFFSGVLAKWKFKGKTQVSRLAI